MPQHCADRVGLQAGSSGSLVVGNASFVSRPERDGLVGGTYGRLTEAESLTILRTLSRDADPGRAAPDIPWAAVVQRPDGTVAATASTMLTSGLFWALDSEPGKDRLLVVATDPLQVAHSRLGGTDWNKQYLHAFARREVGVTTTPYSGIHRIPAGDTLRWFPGEAAVAVVEWCGPNTLPEPDLDGAEALTEYLVTFDAVVDTLAARSGPVVAAMSAGLDSTFMVASLARSPAVTGTITALCHSPLPEAELPERPGWVTDDYPLARQMAERYPGRVDVRAVRNTVRRHPLDAALAAATRSGVPTFAPANQVWLDQIREAAQQAGANYVWHGSRGNATFSFDHPYAAAYYARHRRWGSLASLVVDGRRSGSSWHASIGRVLRELRQPGQPRERYLSWLTHHHAGYAAAFNPAAQLGVDVADPFAARSVLELAARITPREWRRGPGGRAFARRAGAGRVPDDIRSRRERGAQGWDATEVWRADSARAAESARAVRGSDPGLRTAVATAQEGWQMDGWGPGAAWGNLQQCTALAEFTADEPCVCPFVPDGQEAPAMGVWLGDPPSLYGPVVADSA